MTISSTTRKAGPFSGNGATTSFPFTFKVFDKTEIQVTKTVTATGVQSVLVLDSDYSVTLNVDQDTSPGGTITYPIVGAPLPAGQTLDLVDDLQPLQGNDIGNAGSFLPQVIENALDYLTILAQQALEKINRAIKAPVGDSANLTLPTAPQRALKGLVFDAGGNVQASADLYNLSAALTQADADAAAAHADRLAADADAASALASKTAAATSETNAAASASTAYGNAPIFTGTRPSATTAGLAATATNALFKTRQQFGNAVDLWLDNGAAAVLQEAQPFGIGELAERIKAIEGATLADWPITPDILIDCLDMHKWDGRVLPNRYGAQPPSKNIFPANTGDIKLSVGTYNATVTKNYAIGADGVNQTAMRVQFSGAVVTNDKIEFVISSYDRLRAGTYTVVVAVKSNTGKGAQTVQGFESGGGTTTVLAMDETGWVDRTFTGTFAADTTTGSLSLRSLAAGTDFLLDRIRVFEGDGNATPAWSLDNFGHLKRQRSPRGAFANDGLFIDATNSGGPQTQPYLAALSSFPIATSITSAFMLACIKVDNTAQDQSARVIQLDTDGVGASTLGMGVSNSAGAETYASNGSVLSVPNTLDYTRLNILDDGWHIIGLQWDGVNLSCRKWFDHGKYWDWGDMGSGPYSASFFEFMTAGSSRFRGRVSQMALWLNRSTTAAQELAASKRMEACLRARGQSLGSFNTVFITEGDSRNVNSSADPNGPGWNHQVAANQYFGTGKTLKLFNQGWSSSVLGFPGDAEPAGTSVSKWVGSSLYSRLNRLLQLISDMHALGKRVILTVMNDINDQARMTPDVNAYSVAEKAYLQTLRNALDAGGLGSKLFLFTSTPIHTFPSYETPRAALNTLRRAYPGSLVTGIIDIAADATLGTYSSTTAPAGYQDTKHFNKAGGAIAASLAKTAISPYIQW